ncbi:hypothetical protein Tco_0819959 [Tanacetum coccineum]|uniref:Zinc finger, CCHC-type n=1 Tax=Tanacetum coccineum TaxID=301880 RepID=A0ABQ5A817_9ASTR
MLRLELHTTFALVVGKLTLGLLPRYTSCFSGLIQCGRRCLILNCFNLGGFNMNSLTINYVPKKLHDTDPEITLGELGIQFLLSDLVALNVGSTRCFGIASMKEKSYHGFVNTAANGIDIWFLVKRRISRHQHVLIDKETSVEILVLLDLKGRISTAGYEVSTVSFILSTAYDNTEDNSSTSGWVFLLNGGAISWPSKKQTYITSSTMESEFVALAAAGKEAEWLRNLILEIPLWSKPIAPISIRCDSAATLAKAYSQMYNEKSRHLADHLTKGLARDLLLKSVEGMSLKSNLVTEC